MQAEAIENLLLRLPDLVRQQEKRSVEFVSNSRAWLQSLEEILTACRLHQAGSIASLRSEVVAVEQGGLPSGLQLRGRPTRSRALTAVAAQALQRAAELTTGLLAESRPRLSEAEGLASQIVAAAMSAGLAAVRNTTSTNTEFLQAFRRSIASAPVLENATVRLEGLVGPQDALILFDRAMGAYGGSGSGEGARPR